MEISELSPLAGWEERFAERGDASLNLRIREVPFLSQILLRIDPDDAAFAAIQDALAVRLPLQFGAYARADDLDAMWLSPDEWLLVAPPGAAARVVETVAQAAGQAHHMVLDVSANRTCIELRGTDARYVLAKGCNENLAPDAFLGFMCVQVVVAKVPAILQLHAETPIVRLFVRNSFAAHLAEWLLDAAGELVAARRHGYDNLKGMFDAREP